SRLAALELDEHRPLDPPAGSPPERVRGGSRRLGQISSVAADDVGRAGTGRPHLREEQRVVLAPISGPVAREIATRLPGPVDVPVNSGPEPVAMRVEARPARR